jgi:hypothetical protein
MPVYVDNLRSWGFAIRGRLVPSCHMMADTLEELHKMADTIGLRRPWFQDKPSGCHYDLTTSRREQAVEAGAIEIELLSNKIEEWRRVMKAARQQHRDLHAHT